MEIRKFIATFAAGFMCGIIAYIINDICHSVWANRKLENKLRDAEAKIIQLQIQLARELSPGEKDWKERS